MDAQVVLGLCCPHMSEDTFRMEALVLADLDIYCLLLTRKKSTRKVQGVPQSQTAALPRPQEEEETDKSKQAQTEQTYEKH